MVLGYRSLEKDPGFVLSPKGSPKIALNTCLSFKEWGTDSNKLDSSMSLKGRGLDGDHSGSVVCPHADGGFTSTLKLLAAKDDLPSPRSISELEDAALKLQKVYKSYRTRRNLADCAIVVEELWWKALDYVSLNRSSVSFYDDGRSESTVSRWARARTKAAKVGKGLLKDKKAQKLALRHWLEAIDPRHRYGHNLSMYYDIWFKSESTQPFFYWLDIGDGKELNIERCPRHILQYQCIQYLGLKEREAYEVVVRSGKLMYKKNERLVNTTKGSKWIFVLSTCRNLYIGEKVKGHFQHSSFLAGAATTAAGRLVANNGILTAIWPYSGHYLPTEENFKEFITYLVENNVDLTNVKRGAVDFDDYPTSGRSDQSSEIGQEGLWQKPLSIVKQDSSMDLIAINEPDAMFTEARVSSDDVGTPKFDLNNCSRNKWATGAGPRIGCVRDYPADLQAKALEQVSLSPRPPTTPTNKAPIPSPRPGSTLRLSPRIACMGIPSPAQSPRFGHFVVTTPRISLTLPDLKKR